MIPIQQPAPPNPPLEAPLTDGVITRRVIAWLLDGLILAALAALIWLSLAFFTVLTLGFGAPLFALMALLPGAYFFAGLMSPLQATPGQAMMGLIVVRDADLGPPDAAQALVCVIGYTITLALGAIWCAVALLTTRNRTLHDIVAGLCVVRRSGLHQALTAGPPGWNINAHATQSGGRPQA